MQSVIEAAREAARSDRNREAADLFGQAIKRAPERRRELLQEYADQLTYSERARQAVPLYREVLAQKPQRDERLRVLKGLGLALLWSDRPRQALPVYRELVRAQPSDADVRLNLGRALSGSGRPREAAQVLQALLKERADDAETRLQLAQAQAAMGRPDLGRRTLAHASLKDREDVRRLRREFDARIAEQKATAASSSAADTTAPVPALIEAARKAAREDRNRESADLFARAIEQAPQRRRELLQEYADQLTYSERTAQAVPLYREVLASRPRPDERQRVLKGLGLALLWSDQPGQALPVYQELVRQQPSDPDAQRNLARALSGSGRPGEAAGVLQELLRQHPGDREARVQLAQAQLATGQRELARRTLDDPTLQDREDAQRLRRELEEPALAQGAAPAGGTDTAAGAPAPLVEAARSAAGGNRNREAADLFARAIEQAPERRRELLPEYADQLTYSERAAQAVPLYREVLASQPSRDERLRVLKGLGLALLWSDQPTQARGIYEELVREQPADQEARRNLARSMSWSGRQREAAAVLQELLREHPDDAEARVQLAQAQSWMGRPDSARATLGGAELKDREDLRQLRRDLDRASAPLTRVEGQHSTQSDNLDIDSLRLGHEIPFHQGRGMVGARLDGLKFEREDGSDRARVTRPMVRGRYRFSDAAELNAEIGNERIEPRGGGAMDRLVYASWFTWWPNDLVRVDLSTNRSTFDNLRSLRLGLTARQYGVSMDFTPDERQRYTARLERGRYSDGNRRWHGQIEGEYRWHTRPEAWVGLRHTRFQFSRLLDNGYFNPKDFHATQLTLRLAHRPGGSDGRWDLGAFAAWGREHADPGGSKAAYDVSLRAGWRIDDRTRLEGRLQRFSSRTEALSGFERTSIGLTLERSW